MCDECRDTWRNEISIIVNIETKNASVEQQNRKKNKMKKRKFLSYLLATYFYIHSKWALWLCISAQHVQPDAIPCWTTHRHNNANLQKPKTTKTANKRNKKYFNIQNIFLSRFYWILLFRYSVSWYYCWYHCMHNQRHTLRQK